MIPVCVPVRPRLRWRAGCVTSSTLIVPRAFFRWPTGSWASSTTRSSSCPETAWPNLERASSRLSTSLSCRRTWRSSWTTWVHRITPVKQNHLCTEIWRSYDILFRCEGLMHHSSQGQWHFCIYYIILYYIIIYY